MRENYVKVSFVVFSADRQPEVRKGHTLLGCSILFNYSLSQFSNNMQVKIGKNITAVDLFFNIFWIIKRNKFISFIIPFFYADIFRIFDVSLETLWNDLTEIYVLFLTEEAYSHGGLRTSELGQTPSS